MPKSSPVLPQTDAIGRYQVLRRLARGGMAEVLLARVTGVEGFEKLVVLKKILPELAQNRDFVEMFLDEARVLAQLQHTNIAQVYDMGSVGGAYFISMEFLHGQDLRTLLRAVARTGARLSVEHTLSIAAGVSAGLHYAHEKAGQDGRPLGIVHRDVSPHNVFVTYDGAVKVLDFGIAKTTQRPSHTRAGTLKGKIGYMAPEQCRSEELDRRADLFSLGVLMWEMLAGQRLHDEGGDFETMKAICEQDAPLPSSVSPCDPDVERIVMKALARDRAARYQTGQELLEAIEELGRERRLKLSAYDLGAFVRGIFAQQIAVWESARQEGKSLGDHMLDVTRADRNASAPVTPLIGADATPVADAGGPRPASSSGLAGARATRRRRLLGAGTALLLAAVAGGAGLGFSRRARLAREDAAARQASTSGAPPAIHHHAGTPPRAPPPPAATPILGVEVEAPAPTAAPPAAARAPGATPATTRSATPAKRARSPRAEGHRGAASGSRQPAAAADPATQDADALEVE